MARFDWEVVVDNVGKTVVGKAEGWVVEVEDGVVEGVVLDEGVVEGVEELVVVLEDELVVLVVEVEVDGDAEIVEVVVGFPLGTFEVDCGGKLDVGTSVAVGFWPPPTFGATDVVDVSTFGHNVETPLPVKNIPIKVFGYAFVPLHALFIRSVTSSNCVMQLCEHAAPLLKSSAVQPERGEL